MISTVFSISETWLGAGWWGGVDIWVSLLWIGMAKCVINRKEKKALWKRMPPTDEVIYVWRKENRLGDPERCHNKLNKMISLYLTFSTLLYTLWYQARQSCKTMQSYNLGWRGKYFGWSKIFVNTTILEDKSREGFNWANFNNFCLIF